MNEAITDMYGTYSHILCKLLSIKLFVDSNKWLRSRLIAAFCANPLFAIAIVTICWFRLFPECVDVNMYLSIVMFVSFCMCECSICIVIRTALTAHCVCCEKLHSPKKKNRHYSICWF